MNTSFHRILLNAVRLLFLVACATPLCMAQQDRATLLGMVQDSTQAVVAGAEVVVQNQGTGREYKLITDSSGLFVAPEIPVGTYRVTASLQGFKTRIQEGIVLRVSDRTRVVITLEPGEIREVVTVTGEAPLIETASNTLGGTIERARWRTFPSTAVIPTFCWRWFPG